MLRHAAASSIIEYAYNDKAVLAQRLMLTDELYGNTYTVCKVNTHTHTQRLKTIVLYQRHQRADKQADHYCDYYFWEVCLFIGVVRLFVRVQSYEFNTLEKVVRTNPDKLNNIMDEMKQILTPMAQK